MLYYLFRFLESYGIPGSAMWSFISFRSLLALIFGLIISMWFGEKYIKRMRRMHIGETARDSSIDPFGLDKVGVPSMGGIIIIVATLVPVILLGRLRNIYLLIMIVTTVWFGALGFLDDYIKIFKKNKEGLAGRWKLLGQAFMGLAVGLTLYLSPDAVIRENIETQRVGQTTEVVYKSEAVKSTKTTIPFVKNNDFDYASLASWAGAHSQAIGWGIFVLMVLLVITSVSNGANLNDGMDGMAAGNSAIICIALGILAYVSSHIEFAGYLNIMYVPGSQELVVFICAMVGALSGFLWYNAYPAQVFMGDTGSLAIGGTIGVMACIIHKELLVPLLCGVFLFESLSVIIQTQVFRFYKRSGRRVRVFKSTPIHDAFRRLDSQLDPTSTYILRRWPKGAWHESKITVRFWITTVLLAALTIITLKIR